MEKLEKLFNQIKELAKAVALPQIAKPKISKPTQTPTTPIKGQESNKDPVKVAAQLQDKNAAPDIVDQAKTQQKQGLKFNKLGQWSLPNK